MTQIAKYTVSVGYEINKAEVAKVDAALKQLQAKLKKAADNLKIPSLKIQRFSVDNKALKTAVEASTKKLSETLTVHVKNFKVDQKQVKGTVEHALNSASRELSFKVGRFTADYRDLQRALKIALAGVGSSATLKLGHVRIDQREFNAHIGHALDVASRATVFELAKFKVNQGALNAALRANNRLGIGGGIGGISGAEWDRRRKLENLDREKQSAMFAERQKAQFAHAERMLKLRSEKSAQRAAHSLGSHGGLFGGGFYHKAVALALGGYGLSELNKKNQEVQSARLTSQAVADAAGHGVQTGNDNFNWLKKQGDRIGFNYLDNANDFNTFMSNSYGVGNTTQQSLKEFSALSEYSRVMHVSSARQKLVYNAISQMYGKQKVQAEELTKQLANSLPGAKDIFALAWQRYLAKSGKGGGKVGAEAAKELADAMQKGNVMTKDIMPHVADIMHERSKGTLEHAAHTSQSEEARFQNALSDMSEFASSRGVEEGFARIFRTLNASVRESGPQVEWLANAFNETTKYAEDALLSFQSIQRFFQGRDSYLGDKLFPTEEDKQKAFEFLENFKGSLEEIKGLVGNIKTGWSELLDIFDKNTVMEKMNQVLSSIRNGAGAMNAFVEGRYKDAGDMAVAGGKHYINYITSYGRGGANAVMGSAPFKSGLEWFNSRLSKSTPFAGKEIEGTRIITDPVLNAPFDMNTGNDKTLADNAFAARLDREAIEARRRYTAKGSTESSMRLYAPDGGNPAPAPVGLTSQDMLTLYGSLNQYQIAPQPGEMKINVDVSAHITSENFDGFKAQFEQHLGDIFSKAILQSVPKGS
jgi:tape measure domain-containing protein